MKLAVLMSTYNGENFLREQIESILNQKTDVDLTLLIRDDGSTDNTVNILKEYEKNNRVKVVLGKNIGPAKSFISLLKENTDFDYYAFSDQDDVWNNDKIQKGIYSIIDVHGPALYFSNSELVNSDLKSMGRNTFRHNLYDFSLLSFLCLANCAQGCTSVFNKDLAKIIQDSRTPETFKMHDSLLSCVCTLFNGKVFYDNESSMKYRMHEKNVDGVLSVKGNIFNIIRNRFNLIFRKKKVSMYEQTKSLLDVYKDVMPKENIKTCDLVISSRYSFTSRLKLIMSRKLVSTSLNLTITKKLEILFGNA